jgi:hypothetical protein
MYWPKRKYRDSLGLAFRNIGWFIIRMKREEHEALHRVEEPPPRPPADFMKEKIEEYRAFKAKERAQRNRERRDSILQKKKLLEEIEAAASD